MQSGGGKTYEAARHRPNREYRLDCRQRRQSQCIGLQLKQGRGDWAYEVSGQRACSHGDYGQLHHTSRSKNADFLANVRGTYSIHAFKNPDEPLWNRAGNCLDGLLAMQ